MKKLEEIKFIELKENQSYLVIIEESERFGGLLLLSYSKQLIRR